MPNMRIITSQQKTVAMEIEENKDRGLMINTTDD